MLLWSSSIQQRLRKRIHPVHSGSGASFIPDLPPSAEAWIAWALLLSSRRTIVWVADGPRTLDGMVRNLLTLCPPDTAPPLVFPSWEVIPGERMPPPEQSAISMRLETLDALSPTTPRLIATCAQALMELTLPQVTLHTHRLILRPGDAISPADVSSHLETAGYTFGPEVQSPSEASLRGGILDVWPLSSSNPIRIEFFGSEIETMRLFDPLEQRSISALDVAILPPPSEWRLMRANVNNRASFLDVIPADCIMIWSDPDSILQHAGIYEAALRESKTWGLTTSFDAIQAAVFARPQTRQLFIHSRPNEHCDTLELGIEPIQPVVSISGRHGLHPDALETSRRRFLQTLPDLAGHNSPIGINFDTQGTLDRFSELYGALLAETGASLNIGPLTGGFICRDPRVVIVAEPDIYGRKLQRKHSPVHRQRRATGARVTDWTDMEPGDLVVHVEHGVGRYLGLREITVAGQLQEALAIEYADAAKLYVPVAQAHLLTRYVGVGKRTTPLHQLGGKRWSREKQAAESAVQDLAANLLETQAARDAQEGFAYPHDSPWQHDLETAFPYQETDDQIDAIREVKQDMEATRPMDRLLCGDAGYGKTEVAVRAAFKAVMSGKQVAVLVPTTVLAQQHFQTFTERIAPFPVRIEMLSRFGTRGENTSIVAGLADGTVDIVIGTHALIQPTIVFKDLGLVIIDEEQRFGVLHKERFKHIRRMVDVLTLTATPIPRTLYMSLTGARDLSTIQTPPQDRLAVDTIVTPASDQVIREAILRELNREGQVFFLHNRVRTITRLLDRLQRLVPEASYEIAHGQMSAGTLSDVMRRFAANEFDVLLCTTIIESGLDIPNANTILIDRADRFGLAELYQLRGRVGRSKHKAFAYMLLPTQAHIDPLARRRIQAIKQYSGAGSGFRLAMRDLEIRGAGNLLGAEQSGHIAAVGFGLYCQLLRRTIAQKKGEPLPPVIDVDVVLDFISLSPSDTGCEHAAIIPVTYIEDERLRVSMYRRIAEAGFVKEVRALSKVFRDRFGPIPRECNRLLKLTELRIVAAERGISSVKIENSKVMLKRGDNYLMHDNRFPRLKSNEPDTSLDELLAHIRRMPKLD
jgi:transcription-repair coupling factor (superfamily II helicase)